MAQSSTTISGQKTYKSAITATDIRFNYTSGVSTISTSTTSLSNLSAKDLITVSGTSNNNATVTVKSVASDGLSIIVEEVITTEAAGASVTLTYAGFVTDKHKGDGYYSQTDGVHTVSYHVSAGSATASQNFNGKIKMQGSLATTPTEDDWFDISNTTFVADLSTKVTSYTFTGNFVWVRAKTYDQTNTTSYVSKILYNH